MTGPEQMSTRWISLEDLSSGEPRTINKKGLNGGAITGRWKGRKVGGYERVGAR